MRMQSHFPPAWSRATQIARYRSSAAVSANSKTKPLRAGAHGRTTGCLARWPLAPRSVCPNTSPWFPTPLKYAAPPVSTGRAVHQTLTTLLQFHSVLTKRKYRQLFSPKHRSRPGPKGPDRELIDAVVAMKQRNPSWGCPRIAQQISMAFGIDIDKDVVRRLLSLNYRPESGPEVLPG